MPAVRSSNPLLRWIQIVIDGLTAVARILSGLVLLVVMIAIGIDVFLRNVRGAPLGGVVEYSEVALVALAFLAIGVAQQQDGHIAVTSVFERLPWRAQQIAHVVVTLVGVAVCAVLFWYSLQLAITAVQTGEYRVGAARAPMWPARAAVAAGFGLWGAQLLARLGTWPRPDSPADETSPV
jgi:TRAP-type C4-dicarboxylate transport system permease small subunit